jgi:hypothetical protein
MKLARPDSVVTHGRVCQGIVPYVLGVTALKVGNPMSFLVLMEADDPSRNSRALLRIGVHQLSTLRIPIAPFWPCPNPWLTNTYSPGMSASISNTIPPPGATPNV